MVLLSTLNPFPLMNANETNPNVVAPAGAAPPPSFADRQFRHKLRDELRAEEWAMHCQLMDAARAVLKNLQENPHRQTFADVARMLDLSSRLGRLATEPDADRAAMPDSSLMIIEFKAALKRVYARRQEEGRPLPAGAIIEAESVATSSTDAALSSHNAEPLNLEPSKSQNNDCND